MNHFLEDIFDGINTLFIFNNNQFLENLNMGKLMFWIVVFAMVALAIYRYFKYNPLFFAGFNCSISFLLIAVNKVFFPASYEMLYAAELYMSVLLFMYLYLLLLWIPIRLQYDPKAEEKIQAVMMKGPLGEAEMKELYRLKASSREAYQNNVKWLFRLERPEAKETHSKT